MISLLRRLISFTTALALAGAPVLGHARSNYPGSEPAPAPARIPITFAAIRAAQNQGSLMWRARYARTGQMLASNVEKVKANLVRPLRSALQIEITLISMGATYLQVLSERQRLEELTGKQLPEVPSNEKACGGQNATVIDEVLCSGEFMMGATGALATTVGGEVAMGLRMLFKVGAKRTALGTFLSAVAAPLAMTAGTTAASMLWTRAVEILPTKAEQDRAHGLAGRVVLGQLLSDTFVKSADNELFHKIIANMSDILWVDEYERGVWMYNTWRFGLTRGEFLASLPIIMASAKAGELAAAGVTWAATSASTGPGAPLVGGVTLFMISSAVAIGIGVYAMQMVMGSETTAWLTRTTLRWREAAAKHSLNNYDMIEGVLGKYTPNGLYWSGLPREVGRADSGLLQSLLNARSADRADYVNVLIEKYTASRLAIQQAEQNIMLAVTFLQNKSLADATMAGTPEHPISLYAAYEVACSAKPGCVDPVQNQLDEIAKARVQIADAKREINRGIGHIVSLYRHDLRATCGWLNQPDQLILLTPMSASLLRFASLSQTMLDYFSIVFAGAHPELADSLQVPLGDAASRAEMEQIGNQVLNTWFGHTFDEARQFAEIAAMPNAGGGGERLVCQ